MDPSDSKGKVKLVVQDSCAKEYLTNFSIKSKCTSTTAAAVTSTTAADKGKTVTASRNRVKKVFVDAVLVVLAVLAGFVVFVLALAGYLWLLDNITATNPRNGGGNWMVIALCFLMFWLFT
ncbi:hypothetical protein TSUD_249050 [Trifolium subterraneum]|nr:hypothetical protein TSUD_249050 [Trifolium subterraneum]